MRGPGGDLGSPGGSRLEPLRRRRRGVPANGHRVEKSIEYIPISQLDAALKKQKIPAMTVIPVRMMTIHAEIPLKKQIEEIRRALRLRDSSEAARWGPFYDGYEVRRKVSRMGPTARNEVIQDWADYNFEDEYRTRINSRCGRGPLRDGIPGLIHPLRDGPGAAAAGTGDGNRREVPGHPPQEHPRNDQEARRGEQEAGGGVGHPQAPSGAARRGPILYRPQRLCAEPAVPMFGAWTAGGPRMGMGTGMGSGDTPGPMPPWNVPGGPSGKMLNPMDANSPNINMPEIEHLLLRFVDAAVEPGMTYQYQIRLRMRNPNYKHTKEVSKPADAEREFLDSPWVQLADAITVPSETFVYAADWGLQQADQGGSREGEGTAAAARSEGISGGRGDLHLDGTGPDRRWRQARAGRGVGGGGLPGRPRRVRRPQVVRQTAALVVRDQGIRAAQIPDKVIPKVRRP